MNNILLTPVLIPSDDAMQPFDLIQRKSDGLLDIYDTELAMEWSKPERTAKNQWQTVRLSLCSKLDIKERDYCLYVAINRILKCTKSENIFGTHQISLDDRFEITLRECKKIELTTDPKLIADGVPAIDGNTKAIVENYKNKNHEEYEMAEVPFLTEFCKRWNEKKKNGVYFPNSLSKGDEICYECDKIKCICNQNANQKVDIKQLASDMASDESEYRGFIEGFKSCQALQSKTGCFSLEDMRNKLTPMKNLISLLKNESPIFSTDERIQDLIEKEIAQSEKSIEFIQSLTKKSQPKENIIIEYNQETKTLIFK